MQTAKRFVSRLTRQTLALALAGGRGSRLHDLTKWRAKPAVPFGGKFRIIDFPLSNCINSGIGQVGVITQYKSHSLIRHIQRGWGFLRGELDEFVELLPAQQRIETSWYEGTADAVLQNLDIIRSHQPEYVLILAGDHVYKMDYGTMLAAHVEQEADITVGCIEVPVEEASSFGVMSVDDELRVTEFVEKPEQPKPMPGQPGKALASMGIYVFSRDTLFDLLDKHPGYKDFGKEVIPEALKRGDNLQSYVFDDYWEDISDEEADSGVYRGDKHILRVERFLDSLEPGEKFFVSEHMADSHFPWYATERPQAERMGFPEGLDWAQEDGMGHDVDHLNYLQEVTRVDWQVGQMMEDLKERDLYDDTLIIIVGDHGCQWREHGHKYYPGHLYDPALKIPVIIKMPGIEGGRSVDVPVLQMDILATVAELAGIEHSNVDETGAMPGCSLVPFMEDRALEEDYARCEQRDMLLSTHYDMFGYIDDFRYKLIADRLTGTYFLFDLLKDPGEKDNLVDSHPELFQRMIEGLRQEVERNPAFVAGVVR